MGTAYSGDSRVWFTVWNGALTEVYYPTTDRLSVGYVGRSDGNVALTGELDRGGYEVAVVSGAAASNGAAEGAGTSPSGSVDPLAVG